MLCDMMWCAVVICDMIWCDVMWCNMTWIIWGYDIKWWHSDILWYICYVLWCDFMLFDPLLLYGCGIWFSMIHYYITLNTVLTMVQDTSTKSKPWLINIKQCVKKWVHYALIVIKYLSQCCFIKGISIIFVITDFIFYLG